ncbi:SNR27-like protein [Mya arenaria]|uniref:U4/U6.U5 small nuclear ribonucleoprotein 27 kDa protein n=1 Tax=Mya arenaria TaxID=6604 RepID=A0ABY7FJW0_MYAAR|nr:U4/U6.U5 small nuclear ribonucleoprotein 27 kDa protein-like [Mya arenaria]WAR21857.1 SNR27-like protein [Mya arenaria]
MPRSRSRSPKRDRKDRDRSRSRDRERHRRHRRSRSRSRDRRRRSRSRSRDKERRYDKDDRRERRDGGRDGGRDRGREDRSSSQHGSRGHGEESEEDEITFQAVNKNVTAEELEAMPEDEQELMKVMGFSGFDSTKDKQVVGNEHYCANITRKRRYRQYMNRKGGFNRPLDFIA